MALIVWRQPGFIHRRTSFLLYHSSLSIISHGHYGFLTFVLSFSLRVRGALGVASGNFLRCKSERSESRQRREVLQVCKQLHTLLAISEMS
jgi:hypothetical protein